MPEANARLEPPNNKDAEKGVLGSLLRDNKLVADTARVLRHEDFYHFAHQRIYEAMTDLCIHQGKVCDPVTLADYLNEKALVADVGGYEYVAELWESAPTLGHVEHYAQIVRQKSIVRHLIHACSEVQKDALDQTQSAEELLDSAERRILEIAQLGVRDHTKTLQEAIDEAYNRLDARKNRGSEYSGIPTGYIDLDTLTAGMQNSELIILAARPSVGKTAFALNVIRHVVVEEGKSVLFVSLEQARVEIAERLLCCQARVSSHLLRTAHLNSTDMDRVIAAGEVFRQCKLFIDDTPGQNMLRIAANARRLKLRADIRLVVIDYLQLIDPDNRRDSRQEQVSAISRRLKFLARELDIPVIALAQVNRSSEDRQDHKPRLSDLRESGAIEQDADVVVLLHRPELHEPGQHQGVIEVNVAKQRNGPTGELSLTFVKEFMRFENHAVDTPAQYI